MSVPTSDSGITGVPSRDPRNRVIIFDTTLRDGEQSPGATLTADEKLDVADALVALGVDVIEAGFPAASPGDFEAVRAIAARSKGVVIAGLARAVESDIEAAAQAVRVAAAPRIHTFLSSSDIHLQHQMRMSREQALDRVTACVSYARSFVSDVEFSAMDATRSDWDYLAEMFKRAVEAGATTLNVPDTVGYTTPDEYAALMIHLQERVPGIERCIISVHCHDDLGMATANTLAAVKAGARQVEVTVNGIGERAGNTSLEEVVMAIRTRPDTYAGTWTGVNAERLVPTSRIVSAATGVVVQPNKAIVGANAFAHESGIHQDGMLKERSTYEIMNPTDVGWEGTKLVLGKHSGRKGFIATLADLGVRLAENQVNEVYGRFLVLADRKKTVTAADLLALISDELETPGDGFILNRWNASLGNAGPATASVILSRGDGQFTGDGEGNGPVDALFKAIDAATGIDNELVSYHVEAVTPGEDAQGQVQVRIKAGDTIYTGHGLATDIVEASARGYLAALSKVQTKERAAV